MRLSLITAGFLLATVALLPAQIPSRAPQNTDPSTPPLVQWQRTLRDALHLAKLKRLPLLVVANQDNEQACDALANIRYRSAKFAKLAGRYIAVVGSVFRHNPRDFDDQGRRILCPRFGCVTCGEHIAMEPKIYEKFFNGNRTAPRHIGIGVDGKRLFDNFLDRDLAAIDNSLRKHAKRKGKPPNIDSADRSITGLLKSRTHHDRTAVEARFGAADTRAKITILDKATTSGNVHTGLARLALMHADARVRAAGTKLLVRSTSEDTLTLNLQFLGRAQDPAEYRALLAALEGPAKTNDTFRRALTIRRALAAKSKRIDPAQWIEDYQNASVDHASGIVKNEELAALDRSIEANTVKTRQGDPGGKLWMQIARDNFRYALNRMQNQKDPTFLLHDAETAASNAIANGTSRVDAAILRTRILWLLNKQKEAGEQAVLALTSEALADMAGSAATLTLLEVYATTQREPINAPVESEDKYPHEAVTEVHRAYQALVGHPLATPQHAKDQLDFLLYLGARRQAGIANRVAVKRFSGDANLHQYMMTQARWEGGVTELAHTYETLQRERRDPATDYYAGYAMLVVAEEHVRNKKLVAAAKAYADSISDFERSWARNESFKDFASHYAALAHGGIAKMALDAGKLDEAMRALFFGAGSRPATFAAADGLGNTLQRTARRLRRKLAKAARPAFDQKLNALGLSLEDK